MSAFDAIIERRIRAAQEAGLFDDLPGKGKPLPDLHRERPAGWWAARVAKRERSILWAEDLDRELRAGRARLWGLATEAAVRDGVGELNARIDAYNRVTTWQPRPRLAVDEIVDRWRRYQG